MPSRDASYAALGLLPAAVALLTALRWTDGVTCPYCASVYLGGHARYWRQPALPRYQCNACDGIFLLTTDTSLACSRVPLSD
jgi:transposase-like protein